MRYFFGSDVAEPEGEDIPTMAAFRALGLDPDREPEALKVRTQTSQTWVGQAGRWVGRWVCRLASRSR